MSEMDLHSDAEDTVTPEAAEYPEDAEYPERAATARAPGEVDPEVTEADAAEQQQVVELDEDDYR
ncbi:MAG: hypothetical protein ACRDYU_10525 [Actinomycetes bacterium]